MRTRQHAPQNTRRRTCTAEYDNSDAHFVLPRLLCLDQKIHDRDDIQNVSVDFEISDEVMAGLGES
jgi:hypothetical protein